MELQWNLTLELPLIAWLNKLAECKLKWWAFAIPRKVNHSTTPSRTFAENKCLNRKCKRLHSNQLSNATWLPHAQWISTILTTVLNGSRLIALKKGTHDIEPPCKVQQTSTTRYIILLSSFSFEWLLYRISTYGIALLNTVLTVQRWKHRLFTFICKAVLNDFITCRLDACTWHITQNVQPAMNGKLYHWSNSGMVVLWDCNHVTSETTGSIFSTLLRTA